MKRVLVTLFFLTLAACEEPQPPSPAMMQLNSACQSGDMQACSTLANVEAQNRAAYQQMLGNMQANNNAMMQANTALFANSMSRPVQTNCRPTGIGGYGGGYSCSSY
jgi:hypothetical protein